MVLLNKILEAIQTSAFITEFTALVGTLIIALILFALYNSSYIVRKKTKAEAIQKLKLDSIMSVINETKEFKKATKVIEYHMGLLEEKIQWYEPPLSNKHSEIIIGIYSQFEKANEALSERIENFIFLLNRDMILNEETKSIKEEIDKMLEIERIHNDVKNHFMISLRWEEDSIVDEDEYEMIYGAINNFDKKNQHRIINESVERILKIYKKKLN